MRTRQITRALVIGAILLGADACPAGTDFNGDGRDDIVTFVRDSKTGTGRADVLVALSSGSAFVYAGVWNGGFSIDQEIPGTGDFNGDGRDDIVTFVRETKTGAGRADVHVALSDGSAFVYAGVWNGGFSINQEIPGTGDFNGDGRDDIITFIRDTKTGAGRADVYVALSNGSAFVPAGVWNGLFCLGNEIPAIGDFNGDGRDDIITFIRDTKTGAGRADVYVALSTGSAFGPGQIWHGNFCLGNEIPAVGDFNGDGRDDIITFIRNTKSGTGRGDVYIALSTGSAFGTGQIWHGNFCLGNEIPMVGDFTGGSDNRDDIATFVHDTKTGAGRGDVYVARSNGSAFVATGVWNGFFCIGDEVPTTLAAALPQHMFPVSTEDGDSQFVGYASDEESRFSDNVWDFKDEFDSTWPCTQYLWVARRFMQEDHLSFVDSADLAFVSGHGSSSSITMASGQGTDLTKCAWGSWSSHKRRGDLEYIAFESCSVLSLSGDWRSRWACSPNRRRPFAGLHVAGGFKNTHKESPVYEVSDEFAENLEDGYSVRWAWLEATDDENDWVWGHDNIGCAIYIRPHKDEKCSQHNSPDRWYHHSDYIMDADYWVY